jgi:hypothetical protein
MSLPHPSPNFATNMLKTCLPYSQLSTIPAKAAHQGRSVTRAHAAQHAHYLSFAFTLGLASTCAVSE